MNQRGSLENGDGCYSKRNYKCQMTEKSSIPHDPKFNTKNDYLYQDQIGEYFEKSIGNTVEKLENFCKYIPRQRFTEVLAKYEIYKEILDVPGHILELGVLFGGGLMTWHQLATILEPINYARKIIGFDTFSGFPSIAEEDKTDSPFAKVGGLAVDSYEDLKECIRIHDHNRFLNHFEKTSLVKGDIAITVPEYIKNNPELIVSLLYIDVDIFEPTKVALEYIVPRMPKGAIICFDDLQSSSFPGETLALLKTLGIRETRLKRTPHGPGIAYAVLE